jgi:hypothetical protein
MNIGNCKSRKIEVLRGMMKLYVSLKIAQRWFFWCVSGVQLCESCSLREKVPEGADEGDFDIRQRTERTTPVYL